MNKFKVLEDLTKSDLKENQTTESGPTEFDIDIINDKFRPELEKDMTSIADKVRAYVKAQTPIWQQLPYLAIDCHGIFGNNEWYRIIFGKGYYPMPTETKNYDLFIDCENGDLVSYINGPHKGKLADDDEVLYIAGKLDCVNGKQIIKDFKSNATISPLENENKVETTRRYMRREYKVDKIYKRK